MSIRTTLHSLMGLLKISFETVQKAGDDGAFDFVTDLPKGIFDLVLCSSAGNGQTYFDGIWFYSSGGSGAVWEGQFKNPKKQQIKIHIGKGAGQEAYLEIGGERMITLSGGVNGNVLGDVAGGKVTINPAFNIVETRVSGSSNSRRSNGYTGNVSSISPCTIRPWGDSVASGTSHSQHNGGFKLAYTG